MFFFQMIIVDAGSRYGLHPTLNSLLRIASIHLFEADKTEAKRLEKKYKSFKNIHIFEYGLGESESELTLNIKEHPALSTTKNVNDELFDSSERKQQQISVASEVINIKRLDSILTESPDYFKLDIEGMELDALIGAGDLIHSTTGIRCEVQLQAVHQGCSTFSEIDRWLQDKNFELISLDNLLAGRLRNSFSSSLEDGKLLSCDAVWINKNYQNQDISLNQLLMSSIWFFCNGMGSEAITLLLKYMSNNGREFNDKAKEDKNFGQLAKILNLMLLEHCLKSSLLNQEMGSKLNALYSYLFEKEIPPQHLIRYEIELISSNC